jgi:hypothetical protein
MLHTEFYIPELNVSKSEEPLNNNFNQIFKKKKKLTFACHFIEIAWRPTFIRKFGWFYQVKAVCDALINSSL